MQEDTYLEPDLDEKVPVRDMDRLHNLQSTLQITRLMDIGHSTKYELDVETIAVFVKKRASSFSVLNTHGYLVPLSKRASKPCDWLV